MSAFARTSGGDRAPWPPLYPIVDVEVSAAAGWDPRLLARAYVAGGARLLQLRAKTLPARDFLSLATTLTADLAAEGARLIVNDRADLALLAGAAGVHVGQDDLAAIDVRRLVGPDAIVGLSTHTADQIAAALDLPIDYLAIGPVYGTRTKDTGYDAVGLAMVGAAARRAHAAGCPVVAIGGIRLANAREVWEAGADSLAVITDLVGEDPAARVEEWLRGWPGR